ncbi:transmembrane protein, putative [Medicago truncatula]|uniref:Transmembrane protein, putative n=1 Tax=Medicago truncatula TaxID=3880 RepID=G7LG03_MEDTR|nr:transmembrane protein, putative [Medicago truncatula]
MASNFYSYHTTLVFVCETHGGRRADEFRWVLFVGCLCSSPSNDRHSLCLILLRRVVAAVWFVTASLVVQAGSVWTLFEYAERFGAKIGGQGRIQTVDIGVAKFAKLEQVDMRWVRPKPDPNLDQINYGS